MENHTAKHFALQLGSLASLYLSVAFFLVLLFGMIDIIFPDALDSVWQIESSTSMIRFGFAMTVVFFPTYLFLTRRVNKNRRDSNDGTYLGLTKWLIYLSLLVGGAVLLGDLVGVIMGFLEGDLTQRFLLKAIAVFVVAGSAFFYYLKDAQGYWMKNEKQSVAYGCLAAMAIFTTLVVSLGYIETPAEVRERKADQQQVQDLREWQWAVQDYLYTNNKLPEGIMAAYEGRGQVPQAPENRSAYTYALKESGFELCATFSEDNTDRDNFGRPFPVSLEDGEGPVILNTENWYYEAGKSCFEREVRF